MGKIIHSPYDKLVKTTLHNLERAKEFLNAHLSPIAKKYVDLDRNLELVNKEFIKPEQKELRCDIVYRTYIKNQKGYIYTHLEAQTNPDELLAIRMLAYNLEIITWHYKNIKKEIPPIANIILYSGKKSPYPYKVNFLDFLKDHKVTRELIFEGIRLIDMNLHQDTEIEKHKKTAIMELFLKHSMQKNFYLYLKDMIENGKFMLLLGKYDPHYVQGLLLFLADILDSQEHTIDETERLFTGISPELDKDMVSIRQAIENRGIKQGRQEERYSVAQNMLKYGADINFVKKTTGLSKKDIETLNKK